MKTYGALEAGGTKMVLAILNEEGRELDRAVLPTQTPETTMPDMIGFFKNAEPVSLGVGCFGPLDLNPRSQTFGYITKTPKLAWRDYPILRVFREALGVPVGLDTDVNGAALAEARLGAAKDLNSCLYLTVGTGIGGGLMMNGAPVHGLMHPEIGHLLLTPEGDDPAPEGFCPYHDHCAEGLASGPAIEKRWGVSARELPERHPAWALEAAYLAQVCAGAMLAFSPEKIILGGGVMHQSFLLPMIREKTIRLLNGYIPVPAVEEGLTDYIVAPGLGDRSGIMGAWLIAKETEKQSGEFAFASLTE